MTETLPYIEHPCTLAAFGWEIPAALTLPAGQAVHAVQGAVVPSAILLIPGSLFADVNGDFPTWSSFPHVYAHLAHQLSALGHAVYRFAKLGPGTGSVAVDQERAASVRTWDGRLAIATAALDAMRRELESRKVSVERTIGAGHSEGSVVVSRLAVSAAGASLDGVVLLAGPSVGILGIMREQVGFMLAPDQIDDARRRLDIAIDCVRRGVPVPVDVAQGPATGASALASMPDEARRYMRECDATDPLALAGDISQPVLVVQGGKDDSVPTHHGEALRDALRRRPSGDRRTSYLFVPEVSHMFKIVPPGVVGPEAFGYPGATDERVTSGIDAWIRGLAP